MKERSIPEDENASLAPRRSACFLIAERANAMLFCILEFMARVLTIKQKRPERCAGPAPMTLAIFKGICQIM
jgi:hypothetical protein